MSYITTVSGRHFDPMHPNGKDLSIEDIAHALSLICRGNGHTKFFYSVAQHSLACAKEAQARHESRNVILGCLLHDGSEAYLSDVTRPIKKELPQYLEVEARLQNLIWEQFIGQPLSKEEKDRIFTIDDAMLSMEFHQLMAEDISDMYQELTRSFLCQFESPEFVEQAFLQFWKQFR